jgi:hypothetical protein
MHDLSTRAMQKSRQKGAICAALLAAFSCSSLSLAAATSTTAPKASYASSGRTAHEIAIVQVEPGQEHLILRARLAEAAATINSSVDWTIRDALGAIMLHEAAGSASVALRPGDYTVEAIYGAARLNQSVNVLRGTQLEVTFVLNVGGLRILPLLGGAGVPQGFAESRIYAKSGSDAGKLVAISKLPGEVLRVAAGQYRIESRFQGGNAVAITDVVVKPGVMSALNVDHVAGLARLSYAGGNAADIFWQVADDAGRTVAEFEGLGSSLALKPGQYSAQVKIGAEVRTTRFTIAAGEKYDIAIGR